MKTEKYLDDFQRFYELSKDGRFVIRNEDCYACLKDDTAAYNFDSHYIYHTAWAARIVAYNLLVSHIPRHVDISSSIYFVALVSAFMPIEAYDYRSLDLNLKGLTTKTADVMSLPLPDNSVSSLSCMHVVEHIGLGRYGDPIDPDGDLKAIAELKRVLKKNLLFVVPVGRPKVVFNAHRIYGYDQIINYFDGLHLVEFALVTDDGGFVDPAIKEDADRQNYGCGCFWFRKEK